MYLRCNAFRIARQLFGAMDVEQHACDQPRPMKETLVPSALLQRTTSSFLAFR